MKYRIKTEFTSFGNQVIEANSPKDAYKKACEKVFKVNQNNLTNDKSRKIMLKDIGTYLYERPKPDSLIIDEKGDIFCIDGRKYEDYLEENYNLYESDFIDNRNIGNLHYIWGIVANSDPEDEEPANFDTINDIDVVYNSDTKLFALTIEENRKFTERNDFVKHLDGLFSEFKKYMISSGYDSEELKNTNACSVFEKNDPASVLSEMATLEAKTLIDLYYKFKLFIGCYKKITQN